MKATLTLEDTPDGFVIAHFQYEGTANVETPDQFNKDSNAHQHMQIVNRVMDELLSRIPDGSPVHDVQIRHAITIVQKGKAQHEAHKTTQ